MLLLLFLYTAISKQRQIAALKEENHKIEIEQVRLRKKAAEDKVQFEQKQKETMQQLLSVHDAFIKLFADQRIKIVDLSSTLRSKNSNIADKLDKQLNINQREINMLTANLFSPNKIKELLTLNTAPIFLNNNECLILFMLAAKIPNTQIAALLNTTNDSFKTRKYHLKKKIIQNAQNSPDLSILISFFDVRY